MTNTIQDRAQWNLKGRAGAYHVWHAGHMAYVVTEGRDGEPIRQCRQLGEAYPQAMRLHDAAKAPH